MNFNFNQALADKARRQDEELAIKRYEADTGRISAMDNRVSPSNNSGGNKQQVPANNIGNIASIAAQNAQAIQLKQPSNPSRGDYGDIGMLSGPSFNDILDDKPRLKEGGFIEKIGAKLGVRKQEKPAEDPRVNAHRAANQLGGMSGDAARTLRSRQSQIEEEMKRQGYRKGITKVKDKTGKGSPRKDTVDAKLAEGEAVLNAGAAKILGRKSIAELNAKGLQAMGMQGAKPEFKDGKVHAYGGVNFGDPEMMRKAQNAEMRKRLAQGQRMPVSQPVAQPVQAAPKPSIASIRPPIYSVTEMDAPYTQDEISKNAQRARTIQYAEAKGKPYYSQPNMQPKGAEAFMSKGQAVKSAIREAGGLTSIAKNAGGKLLRVAMSAPAAGIMAMLESGNAGSAADDADFAPGGRFRQPPKQNIASIAPQQTTPGDAMALRSPAEPQYAQQVAVPAGYAQPSDRAAQAKQLDALSKQYVEGPLSGRTTDLSNADFAAQGMGDIAKIVQNGKTTYTNVGNRNKYNNEEAQARTVAYKAGEQARAESIAAQMATPEDVEKQTGQFALGQSRKIADLQAKYMAEPDHTKRATMADNIGIMTGKERKPTARRDIVQTSRKTKGFDTEETIPMLYDPETRQWIEPPAQQAGAVQSAPLEVGTKRVINGQQIQWDGKGWKVVK